MDTAPDIAGALFAALAEADVQAPPLEVVKGLVGDGARELIRRALAYVQVARDIDALHARFLTHYRAHVSDQSVVYLGVDAALRALAAAGVATAVVTNKPGDIARRLLTDWRFAIVSGMSSAMGTAFRASPIRRPPVRWSPPSARAPNAR